MRRLAGIALAALAATMLISGSAQASFTGRNGKIAFGRSGCIYSVQPDGTGLSHATPCQTSESWPAWGADGRRLGYFGPSTEIDYVTDGQNPTILYDSGIFNEDFAWSPDGSKLVGSDEFCFGSGGCHETLFTFKSDGSGAASSFILQQHDNGPIYEGLSWSPDGTKIAFVAGTILSTIHPDGSGLTQVANDALWANWSPGGSKIAFVRFVPSGATDVWIMNSDGTGKTQLTTDGHSDRPVWSPDGTKIAFERIGDIFVMNADGTGQSNVTNTPTINEAKPDWQPIPGPGRSDYPNSNQFCKAEQAFWGDQFSQRYRNFGHCVSGAK